MDYIRLLEILDAKNGLDSVYLEWVNSYMSGRTQKALFNGVYSETEQMHYRVPPGSVIGPVLYGLYITPLKALLEPLDCSYHFYVDDTHDYLRITRISDEVSTYESSVLSIVGCKKNETRKSACYF